MKYKYIMISCTCLMLGFFLALKSSYLSSILSLQLVNFFSYVSNLFAMSRLVFAFFIFLKNMLVVFILSLVTVKHKNFISLMIFIVNGIGLGIAISIMNSMKFSRLVDFLSLAPHGSIELIGLITAFLVAIKNTNSDTKYKILVTIKTTAPIFILAALIEVYVTPWLVNGAMHSA